MKKIRKILAMTAALAVLSTMSTGISSAFAETRNPENSAVYLTGSEKKLPEWVPTDFTSALEFSNKYGKTHAADGVACIVRMDMYRNSDIWLSSKDNGSTYDYEKHILLKEDYSYTRSEDDTYLSFENPYFDLNVMVYEVPKSETLSLSCGTFGGIAAKFNKEYDLSFSADADGNITETDFYGWLPDCVDEVDEYEEFSKSNDNVFIKDGYIVFHDEVSASCGQQLKDSYKGTGSAEKVLDYGISMVTVVPYAGGSSPKIIVYKPTSPGDLVMKWDIYGPSEKEPPIKAIEQAFYVDSDMSVRMVSDDEPAQEVPCPEYSGVSGDANNDGIFNVADLIALNRWISGNYELAVPDACVDLNGDDTIDVFDVCKMRRMLIDMGFDVSAVSLSDGIEAGAVTGAEADEEFILGQTQFALSLMQKEVKDNANVLVSPYSVMQALAMTANGADSDTKAEMEKVLGNGMSIDSLNKYLYTQRISQPNDDKCKLSTANSIWTRDNKSRIEVYPEFLQKNADYFGADVFKAPFDDTTVNDINSWVKKNTDDMIPKIIDQLSQDDVMCLVNAVAFDAKWEMQYSEYDVNKGKFTAYNGEKRDVEMMSSEEYSYLKDENAAGFLKYYKGGRYAFAALLPNEGVSVTDYISGLTAESFNKLLSNPERTTVYASLPKFSYDFDTLLNDTLSDMGMPDAFNKKTADFSKMGKTINNLYINKVFHKTHIEVAEDGTRAGAATGVLMANDSCVMDAKSVILDRPFVYCIVDMETRLPVFIGTLMDIE